MEAAWLDMKLNISLANKINTTDTEVATFHEKLQGAVHTSVDRCRVERKRKVAAVQPADLSDDTLRASARFTDGLPLANYDGILHLVPRLVNVVTDRSCAQTFPTHTRADKHQPPFLCVRSWQRQSQCLAAG